MPGLDLQIASPASSLSLSPSVNVVLDFLSSLCVLYMSEVSLYVVFCILPHFEFIFSAFLPSAMLFVFFNKVSYSSLSHRL